MEGNAFNTLHLNVNVTFLVNRTNAQAFFFFFLNVLTVNLLFMSLSTIAVAGRIMFSGHCPNAISAQRSRLL